MRHPLSKALFAALGMFTCLAGGVCGGDGVVLCLGDGGHVAIEFAVNGKCVACTPGEHHEAPLPQTVHASTSGGGACMNCVDVPLRIEMLPRQAALSASPERGIVPPPYAAPAKPFLAMTVFTAGGVLPVACGMSGLPGSPIPTVLRT